MKLQEMINRLIKRGSWDLLSDPEFKVLSFKEQMTVRNAVSFAFLQES